jgi:quinoprotein glucose dehydrogenase
VTPAPRRALGLTLVVAATALATAQVQRATTPGEWRHYAGDAGSTKYAPLDQINAANVNDLRVVWEWKSPDDRTASADPQLMPGSYEDTPLMVDGVLYTVTGLGVIAAVDPANGKTLWQYDPESWKGGRPPNLGLEHRGLSYWTDGSTARIIAGTHDAYLVSIDAKTGVPDPAFGVNGRVDVMAGLPYAVRGRNYAISSTPVVVRNVIVHGANISDGAQNKEAPRGDVSGYDVRTGRKLWTFNAVPRPGEVGNETWEKDAWAYTGNTNVWSMISADEALGYVYLPFGTPTNDYYGGHRHGDNLFGESLVCLDATTGKRIWHFQAVHHGLWDYDFPAAPILGDITVDGRRIPIVAQVSKQAFVYVFDRRTGVPVWPIEERPVPQSSVPGEQTAKTQPFPTRPPPFDRQGLTDDNVIDFTPELQARALEMLKPYDRGPLFTPPSERGSVQLPGNGGGANWSGAAFDPETGRLYVPSATSPLLVQLIKPDPANSNLQYRRGNAALPTIDGLRLVKPPYGRITAYDLNAGAIDWQVPLGEGPRNHPLLKHLGLGPLGSSRGTVLLTKTLLFAGARGGERVDDVAEPPTLQALDKQTGRTLWTNPLPHGPVASPMTYLHNGVQHIVVAVGGGRSSSLVAFALSSPRN